MIRRILIVPAVLLLVAAAIPAMAGSDEPIQGYAAFGYSETLGQAGDALNPGWNISGGMVYHPAPSRPFGIRVDLGYNNWNAESSAIAAVGQPTSVDGGYASMWTLTADATWHFGQPGHIGGYVGAGIGGYRRYAALTNTVTQLGYICDPWWGCYYATYLGDQVVKDDTLTKFGYNAAVGMTFPVGGGDMYVEARYHYVDMNKSVEFMPIVLGYRF
jgi:opacity protein-like surface antigen